ncbi:MAG: SOSS complex subunit B family protein [Candidatus Woesearchaeota archaeon]|nr:SOSS complex subunit B family protein [Candidatus Woesearchaeota archaeon]
MKISELKPRQGSVDLIAEVIQKKEVREFEKFGRKGKVCNAIIKDDSGQISLTLWNEQVDKVNVGDKIKITNGYVNEWQGELQLTTGKFGALEVLGPVDSEDVQSITDDELTEEDIIEYTGKDEPEHVLTEDEKEEEELIYEKKDIPSLEESETEDEKETEEQLDEDINVDEEKVE